MPEVLRDLVVTLSLQSDNFSRNINSINRQIREAESSFRLAGAGIDNFGNTTAGMTSRLSMLQTNLGHQRDIVSQYERALASANSRLQESHARYQQYSQRLTEARQRHTELAEGIRAHENELRVLKDEGHENTIAYAEAEAQLEGLRQEYAASGDEVKKLEGQCTSLQRAMQRDADAVSRAQTELNNARATVRETEAEIRRLTQQLQISRSAWTQAGAALTAFSTKLTAIGKSATALGRRMTVMITTPIVAMGKKIVQASLDFESSFAYVRKTVQATEEQYDQLAAASKRLSTQIATSTTDINHVMSTGGQLGIATEHIEEFSRVMIDLANSSTDLDADTAATSLAKFANIMGTDQSLFRNIGSTVAELGNNFATTEEPIVTMAMRIAGAGKQIGLTEPQVLGLAAALSSVGIKAQAGGSSMSKALINMEVAARTGGDALKDFAMVSGLTEQEFVEQWDKDPVQVFQKFIEGLGRLDDEGASAVKTLNDIGISEIRLRDTLLRATNASELFSNAQKMATQAWKENTALETMASKRYATLQSRLTNLKNRAVLFAQTLGDDLRPTIERVMESIGKFIDRLQNMDQGQRLQIMRFAALAAAAGPVILIFGRLATGLGKITGVLGTFCTAVGKAGGGVSGLLSVLGKSPAVWLAVAAAVAYGTFKLLDWASGAKMAQEATHALIDKAKEWKDTALSFSPSVVAVGETATMSITIKNVSGKSITKCYVYQDGRYPSTNYQYGGAFPTQFLYGGGGSSGWDLKTISWGNNVSHTFTATVSFKEGYYHLDTSNYVLDPSQTYIAISVVTNATFSSGGNYDNLYIRADGSYLRILSQRDNPKLTLEIERTPNDEAVAVKTTAKLTADVASSVLTAHGYTIKLTATNAHNPALPTDTAVTFNATLSQLITGITNSTSAITATFSAATDWYFLLTVSNGYETTNAYGSIPRAFANIHLAGLSTGGVAFGKFSSSTQGNPLFECEFPAYFNAGIASHEYHDGDTVTINGGTFFGYVTGSTKALHFVVPLRKSLERITSVTLTRLVANIANAGGYAISSSHVSGGSNYMVSSVTNSVSVDPARNVLEVYLTRSSAWNLTNNTNLSVRNEVISFVLHE